MKKNNSKFIVPRYRRGVFKKKFLKYKMWYIGSIYRASKGQYIQNKFLKNFFAPHLYVTKRSAYFFKTLIWRKFFKEITALSPRVDVFGNIEKSERRYYNDEGDQKFFKLPKPTAAGYFTFTKGVIYSNTRAVNFKNFDEITTPPESFFYKGYLQSNYPDFFFKKKNLETAHNDYIYYDTKIVIYSVEYYKILQLATLIKLITLFLF